MCCSYHACLVLAVKPDRPVVQLALLVTRDDGTRVLEGEAWVYVARPEN